MPIAKRERCEIHTLSAVFLSARMGVSKSFPGTVVGRDKT
jgi:hypothetical protein